MVNRGFSYTPLFALFTIFITIVLNGRESFGVCFRFPFWAMDDYCERDVNSQQIHQERHGLPNNFTKEQFSCNRVVGNLFTMFEIVLLRVVNFKYARFNGTPRAWQE